MKFTEKIRCTWCGDTEIYINYHDKEWGRPEYNDKKLYEILVLESMQAGLSWITILKKRENYRKSFDEFDYEKIALYDEKKIEELMNNQGIIRNRAKINSIINNAKIFIRIREEYESFSKFIWKYVNYKPIINKRKISEDVPSTTDLSTLISKDLKKLGFKFLGPTIIYSFMQAIGMVNDHIESCFVYEEIKNKKIGKICRGQNI